MKKIQVALAFFLLLALGMSVSAQEDVESMKIEAVNNYADIVYNSYQDAYALVLALDNTLIPFVENPSEEGLQAAREAWLAAREVYGQTEAYRFYGGAIDGVDGPEGLINAWPLDEAYIDYVEGDEDAGIINNVEDYPEINKELLVSLNESGGEANISVGFHAIEFLLWGQDLSEDGAGQRPYTDYTTAPNAERRGQYLLAVGELLVVDLDTLVQAWSPDVEDNYRAEFLALPADEALRNILTGIGVLSKSELAGERMFTAYDNQDQEDEHSCFSDNTHRDIVTNFLGIKNVYTGTYTLADGTELTGTSISDIVAVLNPELNDTVLALLATAEEATAAIPAPFDQAIIEPESRELVFAAVSTLLDLGDSFVEVADTMGIVIDTALPG
jgi:putative iron-regulated protein